MTTINPLVDRNGKVYRLISTSINISQRKEIEVEQRTAELRSTLAKLQQALKSEELVRSITEAIRDSLDEKQVLQTATKSLTEGLKLECCQIELYKYEGSITEVICEYPIVLPDERGIHRQVKDFPELYARLLNKESIHFVDWLPTVGHRQQRVTRLVSPIFDDRGILGNIWLMRPKESIFEPEEIQLVQQIADQCAIAIRQARLYKAEQIQVKELEKLNLVKDDFLKTISHELRTPMSRLRLAISTLENLLEVEIGAHQSPKINKVMEIFHSSFKKQNQLVDDLLTLCYVDAASKPDLWQEINLPTWIPQIVKTFSLGERQQTLQLDLAQDTPILRSDAKMLKRVVHELLNNAYKYTPPDGHIIICTNNTPTQLLIKVINTGIEIPIDEQERIFDKFYRIPNRDPWQHGGTGIGLALVKKLVKLLGGEITVSSQEQTTTFTIAFSLN
nr:GAF domain-containing sensor histidine kinase [Waterburya agarophytonicola]